VIKKAPGGAFSLSGLNHTFGKLMIFALAELIQLIWR
jgi:hypothetical protein